jgi:branched-chain amino acid transport system ATP-binding protein
LADKVEGGVRHAEGGVGKQVILQLHNVVAGYGKADILRGVSLQVYRGQLVVIIGPNGAGKSTVLRTIYGQLVPRQGSIRFAGQDIVGLEPPALLRLGLSYIPQGRNIFPLMSVYENLELGAYIRKDTAQIRRDIERVCERFPILGERRHQAASALSGGELQMLEMARALLLTPSLMLIDEPTMGLAPDKVEAIFASILEVRAMGTTVVMVEQNAKRALELGDYAFVLELGQNRFEGPAHDILANPQVRQLYLGG